MDLSVIHAEDSPTAAVHCFVSLPTEIASSLAAIKPFASLTILHLHQRPDTSIYLAWAADTHTTSDSIALHPALCDALSIRIGDIFTARITERVVSQPRHILLSAVITPISYHHITKESQPDKQVFLNAERDFRIVSTAASTLERTILTQIRVVYEGLVFPLKLPAHHTIPVCVSSVRTSVSSHDDHPPYAVVCPQSEMHVASPPPNPYTRKNIRAFFRVAPPQHSSTFKRALTHAYIRADGLANEDTFYMYISRKSSQADVAEALPVACMYHEHVPDRHIVLPPAVWHRLRLLPYAPVFVEEVDQFADGGKELVCATSKMDSAYATFADIRDAHAVYYEGMRLCGMYVRLSHTRRDGKAGEYEGELCDTPGLKQVGDEPDIFQLGESIVDDFVSKDLLLKAAKNRKLLEGFCSFDDQKLAMHTRDDVFEHDSGMSRSGFHPFSEQSVREALLGSLTPSCSKALHQMMLFVRPLFKLVSKASQKGVFGEALVVEGLKGCGKTHVCKAFTALLRNLAYVRTVWIRCRVHEDDETEVLVQRIREAFRAASDCGPGCVVLDDVHAWCAKGNKSEEKQANVGERRRRLVAAEIDEAMSRKRAWPVLLILSCVNAMELDQRIRSPGIVGDVVSLDTVTTEDIQFLYWQAVQEFAGVGGVASDEAGLIVREAVTNLAKECDGYRPRDVQNAVKRAKILHSSQQDTSRKRAESVFLAALTEVCRDMIPIARAGVKFSGAKKGEVLSWSRLGGIERVKHTLWEALELPSMHPDIFANAPIRLPHGILLYGPPGCGKTMIARTAAAESKMRCIVVKGPELMSKYIGESEAEVRRSFEKAASSTPCVLLFDEFDALAPRRGGVTTGVSDRVVNTLLTCMDGAERLSEGVYVLATTSRPELIDPALLRPGRLDKWVAVDVPSSEAERLDILECVAKNFFVEHEKLQGVLQEVAEGTDGYTGADLGSIINDANLALTTGPNTGHDGVGDLYEVVCQCIRKSKDESRPSLSKSQREHYYRVMARFSPEGERPDSDVVDGTTASLRADFGRRVALK